MTLTEIAGIVAAGATVVAVGIAYRTVKKAGETLDETRAMRAESTRAHHDELRQETELLDAIVAAKDATTAEAAHAMLRELALQRLVALGRIADLLREIVEVARAEHTAALRPDAWSPVTPLMVHLEVAVDLYCAMGGERIASEDEYGVAELSTFAGMRGRNIDRGTIADDAVGHLERIVDLAIRDGVALHDMIGPAATRIDPAAG